MKSDLKYLNLLTSWSCLLKLLLLFISQGVYAEQIHVIIHPSKKEKRYFHVY